MLEEKKNKLKEMFLFKREGNDKKKIENLVVFIIILVITIIFINTIWNSDKEKAENNTGKVLADKIENDNNVSDEIELELEQRLEKILKKIEGVGNVNVLLTYSETSRTLAMYNEDSTQSDTQESDNRTEEIEK